MLDNEKLKTKLKIELKELNLSEAEENRLIREINYLSDLLIDVYVGKTSRENRNDI